jgi:CrcB protein
MRAALVGIAGAAGALCRYGIGLSVGSLRFPWVTLGINVAGSFLLGLLLQITDARGWSPDVTVPLAVGFLGAFTTFSTFTSETHLLLRADRTGTALAYAVASVGVGLVAAVAGHRLGGAFR